MGEAFLHRVQTPKSDLSSLPVFFLEVILKAREMGRLTLCEGTEFLDGVFLRKYV